MAKKQRIHLILLTLFFLASCATPTQQFSARALNYGFTEQSILGQKFKHRIYANRSSLTAKANEVLHVYIDGDGTPWQHYSPTEDPTSRNLLILELMAQDFTPSILLGRPCYHGFYADSECQPIWWTDKRYATEIVESMAAALNRWLENRPFSQVVLIGYSGGGTLAVLMADKIPKVQTVVTLAANLDVAAWTQAHGYEPLPQSLNPIQQKKLPSFIKQLHFAGGADKNVLPEIVKAYAVKQHAHFYIFLEFDHECCWQKVWTTILSRLSTTEPLE